MVATTWGLVKVLLALLFWGIVLLLVYGISPAAFWFFFAIFGATLLFVGGRWLWKASGPCPTCGDYGGHKKTCPHFE